VEDHEFIGVVRGGRVAAVRIDDGHKPHVCVQSPRSPQEVRHSPLDQQHLEQHPQRSRPGTLDVSEAAQGGTPILSAQVGALHSDPRVPHVGRQQTVGLHIHEVRLDQIQCTEQKQIGQTAALQRGRGLHAQTSIVVVDGLHLCQHGGTDQRRPLLLQ